MTKTTIEMLETTHLSAVVPWWSKGIEHTRTDGGRVCMPVSKHAPSEGSIESF